MEAFSAVLTAERVQTSPPPRPCRVYRTPIQTIPMKAAANGAFLAQTMRL